MDPFNLGGNDEVWYFSREEIEDNSPSRLHGISSEEETLLRNSYTNFLKLLRSKLNADEIMLSTAMLFCHRFFLRQSHAKNHSLTVAMICMFLAGKVEGGTPLNLEHVIIASKEIIDQKTIAADQRQEVYEQHKENVLSGEKLVLSTLNFDLNVDLPYNHLITAMEKFICDDAAKDKFCLVAGRIVHDCYRTTICLQYKARHIAACAFFFGAYRVNLDIESNEEIWCQEFDIMPDLLEEIRVQACEVTDD